MTAPFDLFSAFFFFFSLIDSATAEAGANSALRSYPTKRPSPNVPPPPSPFPSSYHPHPFRSSHPSPRPFDCFQKRAASMPAGRTLRRYTNDEDGDSSAGPSQHASSTPSRPPAPSSSDQSSLQQRPPPSTPPLSSSDFQDIPRSEDCSRRQVHLSLMQPISYPEGTYGQYSPGMSAKLPRWVKPGSKWQLCEEDLPTEELFQWFEIQVSRFARSASLLSG